MDDPRTLTGSVTVRISAKSARLTFNGCDEDYIRNVCHGRCCESASQPTGTLITVHPFEQGPLIARGARIVNNVLQNRPGERKCMFKTGDGFCGIHFTPDKPFGCIASPFMLNPKGTLVIRNRYKMLICFKAGPKLPAYVAFRASLDLIFGHQEAARICQHLASGGDDLPARMPRSSYAVLMQRETTLAPHHHGDPTKKPKPKGGTGTPARSAGGQGQPAPGRRLISPPGSPHRFGR